MMKSMNLGLWSEHMTVAEDVRGKVNGIVQCVPLLPSDKRHPVSTVHSGTSQRLFSVLSGER